MNSNIKESKDNKKSFFRIDFYSFFQAKVSIKEKLFFTQYLSLMLKSGISLSVAINTLSLQTSNKYFAKVLKDISENIQRGVSFTESLKPYERIFGELYINMVEAGEISGRLEEVLNTLHIQLKKQYELISKIKGALLYPMIILIAMIAIGILMIITIIPELIVILKGYNIPLPWTTKAFIYVNELIINNIFTTIFIIFLILIFFIQIKKTKTGKYFFEAIILRIPIIKNIVKKVNLTHFSRTISTLLKTDIMIIKTFQITANTLTNLHYRNAVLEMAEKIKKGNQITEILDSYPLLFSPAINQIVSVGEKTGELDNVLSELAEFYEKEIDQTMNNLPAIIEPIMIIIIGILVSIVALAITSPYYALISSI